jgi:hypothetical protein
MEEMIKNQEFRAWLAEQPLVMALTRPSRLRTLESDRAIALIVVPLLAFALVITGGIGVGYAAMAPSGVSEDTTTTAALEELGSSETALEELVEEVDPLEAAIASWGVPDLAAILAEAYPGAEWSLSGNSYSGLVWFGPGAKPTEAELLALWVTVGPALAERRATAEIEAQERLESDKAAASARSADPTRQELCRSLDYRALQGSIDYTKILSIHYSGAQWSLNGDSYSGLTWFSPGAKPSKASLDALWDGVAFELCLQRPLSELQARTGTGESEEYVEGELRPKGFSDEAFVASPANCRQLPQIAHTNGGSPAGSIDIYKDPTGSQNFEQLYGMDLTELGCRIAQAHGYFGGKYNLGLGLNGDQTLMWYSSQVDMGVVQGVLASIGALR